jgi:hypothetical protein
VDQTCPQHVLKGAPVSKNIKNNNQYLCRANYAAQRKIETALPDLGLWPKLAN